MSQTAKEVIAQIEEAGAKRKKPDNQVFGTMNIGEYHWQGDVRVTKVKAIPEELTAWPEGPKLATGTTRGARHIISPETMGNCKVMAPPKEGSNDLQGPFIKADGPIEITHPDHGHITVPAGNYSINYQRQFADEIRRVAD
jgi:hypothetical protein